MTNTKIYGVTGEQEAKNYLIKKGYKIVKMNFSCKIGEIDIIAMDKDTLVFVEVKARNTAMFGLPREAVTAKKQYKIRRIAELYLQRYSTLDQKIRFDVIEILGDKITHIENAF